MPQNANIQPIKEAGRAPGRGSIKAVAGALTGR